MDEITRIAGTFLHFLWGFVGAPIAKALLVPASALSLVALAISLGVAVTFLAWRRRGRRELTLRVLRRALFPRSIWTHPSFRADVWLTLFNLLIAGVLFGGMIMTSAFVASGVSELLAAQVGRPAPPNVPAVLLAATATLILFLAYEFGYWLDHYLKHRFAVLWAFHAVHHSAERLNPLTFYRVHPGDTILFYNLLALVTGTAQGLLFWAFGANHAWAVGGANVLMLVYTLLFLNLQHSELWIALPGRWGRIFMGPAHHQIHHSADPRHFNRNFGASFALFDRLFGTLHVPGAKREVTRFGIGPVAYDPHGVTGTLVTPFVEAATATRGSFRQAWAPSVRRTPAAAPAAPARSVRSDRTPATRPASAAPAA